MYIKFNGGRPPPEQQLHYAACEHVADKKNRLEHQK